LTQIFWLSYFTKLKGHFAPLCPPATASLLIGINHSHLHCFSENGCQTHGAGGFAHTTFAIMDDDNQGSFFHAIDASKYLTN
jgi:hypothetical protein